MASIADENTFFRGSCACGKVRFSLKSLPTSAYICHCLDCRRSTGSSFAHNAAFSLSSLSLHLDSVQAPSPAQNNEANDAQEQTSTGNTKDHALSTFGNDQDGKVQFCGVCGTTLFLYCGAAVLDMKDKVIVPVGVIDGSHNDERFTPQAEGWCKRRESWMPSMRGTTSFDEW